MESKDGKITSTPPRVSTRIETPESAPIEVKQTAPVKDAGIKYEDTEETRFLLGQKLAFANTVSQVSMTWWVSSVVFCASILAAVWLKRADLIESGIFYPLGIFLCFFFAGVVIFGAQITWHYLRDLRQDLSNLPKKADGEAFFSTELKTFKRSMFIGTASFFLILIVWVFFLIGLALGWWK